MASSSLTRKQLSRSKVDLFLECPRCFYEDVARNNPRPGCAAYTLNNAVDELFKREFDSYRERQEPHPLFATASLDAVPLKDDRMDAWRKNVTGVRWLDADTTWTLFGAVDDLWLGADKRVIVADYKATSKKDSPTTDALYPAYQCQAEIYQFLVARQGFEVNDRAWFVYANGIKTAETFGDTLRFNTTLVPYDGNRSWVLEAFRAAVALATSTVAPEPTATCQHCRFAGRFHADP